MAAAEAKRLSLDVEGGETVIVNASLPDGATDIDLYAYPPGSDREPIVFSANGPGRPDNLRFAAQETGRYGGDRPIQLEASVKLERKEDAAAG